MRNHFHLVVETPEGNLVEGMRWLLSSYTLRLNHRHKLFGHVFSGRYKSLLIDGSSPGYLKVACDYVHLNPVRGKLLACGERPLAYPWSSWGWYLAAPEHRPKWMRVDRLLGEHGLREDTAEARQELERRMEVVRAAEGDGDHDPVAHGDMEERQRSDEKLETSPGREKGCLSNGHAIV